MKRPHRRGNGSYSIKGHSFRQLVGSRQQVFNGNAYKTSGNLVKSGLMMNQWGRIVSATKHRTAKKENRLAKHGYFPRKDGIFGVVKGTARRGRGRGRTARRGRK